MYKQLSTETMPVQNGNTGNNGEILFCSEEEVKKAKKAALERNYSVDYLQDLTDRERDLLKESFENIDTAAEKNGVIMFLQMFQDYPDYKKLFPKFKYLNDEALMSTGELRNHASVYMQGLRDVVESLNDNLALVAELKKIASSHRRRNVERYHIMNMLPMVLCVIKSSRNGNLPSDMKDAWTKLFTIIADLVESLKPRK